MGRAVRRDLEPDGQAELPLRELAFQRLPQVLDFFFVEPEIRVARHAELRVRDDLASLEHLVRVLVDHARQKDERVGRHSPAVRQRNDPRQKARRLQDRDARLAAERVLTRELDDEVQALVDDEGKRVRRIEADRRQQRLDLALEILGHPRALPQAEIQAADQPDTRVRKRRQDFFVQHPILFVDQPMRLLAHGRDQRAQADERHARRRNPRQKLLLQSRHPDLEEFVEVAADDAQEAQTLEQRYRGVVRQREHAPVEREMRQLAVERRRIVWIHRAVGRWGIADGRARLEVCVPNITGKLQWRRQAPRREPQAGDRVPSARCAHASTRCGASLPHSAVSATLGTALPPTRWLFVPPTTLAVVDLGSNSFRLEMGRVEGDQVYQLDTWRETLRLGAGLDAKGRLKPAAMQAALACLARFRERLSGLQPSAVRVVATNTFRVARNAREFLVRAERAIGFPIDVISGHEEARLTYFGVAHELPRSTEPRLVIDIGGGSTEFIIGRGLQPERLESLTIGCVGITQRYFAHGAITAAAMEAAETEARAEIEAIAHGFGPAQWREAYASSGSAMALADILEQNAFSQGGITPIGLARLRQRMLAAGHISKLKLNALKGERAPVLAGGLAIMTAAVSELSIERVDAVGGALRLGVLYDLLGRTFDEDARAVTVERFIERYGIDRAQGTRVATLAVALFRRAARKRDPRWEQLRRMGGPAARGGHVGIAHGISPAWRLHPPACRHAGILGGRAEPARAARVRLPRRTGKSCPRARQYRCAQGRARAAPRRPFSSRAHDHRRPARTACSRRAHQHRRLAALARSAPFVGSPAGQGTRAMGRAGPPVAGGKALGAGREFLRTTRRCHPLKLQRAPSESTNSASLTPCSGVGGRVKRTPLPSSSRCNASMSVVTMPRWVVPAGFSGDAGCSASVVSPVANSVQPGEANLSERPSVSR